MRKLILCFALVLPTLSFANQFTGRITTILLDEKGSELTFEIANSESAPCESSWFKLTKAVNQEISPAQLVIQSYFSKTPLTIFSSDTCGSANEPGSVSKVGLGKSTDEVKAFVNKMSASEKKDKK